MAAEKILVVDDETNILEVLKIRLEAEGYAVTAVETAGEALAKAREEFFNLAITDLKLGSADGLELMENLLLINPDLPVIILTAYGTIESAVQAVKKGAYSYLTKPFDHKELSLQIRNALEKQRLMSRIRELQTLVQDKYNITNIVGKSEKMKKVFEQIGQIAATDFTVYIYGESGTGKELVAKAIHCNSLRASQPFVAVNCGALPETLLESELFGHVKGAFTDAHQAKKGLFAQADKGTIFLDDISEAPPSLQIKLLRVLQEQEIRPVGSDASQKVDVRVIVATNKDLAKEVQEGRFREDLFYRIHVIPIELPPLRERKEDIPLLADYFLKKYSQGLNKTIEGLSPEALHKMMLYDWPGNVRELENKMEYAVAMCRKAVISPDDIFLAPEAGSGEQQVKALEEARLEFEKEYLINLLKINKGHVARAAKMAKRQRSDLYYLIKKYNINPADYR